MAVFKRAEQLHPGAGRMLTDMALHLVGGPATMAATAGQSPTAAIFLGDHADLFLYYCSSAAALLKEVPDLTSLPVPEALEVHPTHGMAILSGQADALRFTLFVFSRPGQALLAGYGFEPLVPSP